MSFKPILDACCGSRMSWFDKENPAVLFCDNREVPNHEYYPGRFLEVKPDVVCDFTALPFTDKSFKLVVFDPPHLRWAGETSWLALKYGRLDDNWPEMLRDGFSECMRVLDDYGTLIFKWNAYQIPTKKVIEAIGQQPLFGNRSGKAGKTHWMAFMKLPKEDDVKERLYAELGQALFSLITKASEKQAKEDKADAGL